MTKERMKTIGYGILFFAIIFVALCADGFLEKFF